MIDEYRRILERFRARQKETQRQMLHLSKFNRTGFDATVHALHDEAFAKIDCLKCGNCCRMIGPRFRDKDVKILAKDSGLEPKAFVLRYLKPDGDDQFYLLAKLPCPFLNEDESCSVYDKRPLSCEEFPYTNTKNIQRHLVRLGYSAQVCPAAALIAERIIDEY